MEEKVEKKELMTIRDLSLRYEGKGNSPDTLALSNVNLTTVKEISSVSWGLQDAAKVRF